MKNNQQSQQIFLTHGIYMHGYVMKYLAYQLESFGYLVHNYSYRSVSKKLANNADDFSRFVRKKQRQGCINHFVGHSLGGLLIRLLHERDADLFTGRIVTLGTPHQGSLVAQRLANSLHPGVFGGAYIDALDGDLPPWEGRVELGSIAGTKCIGIGMAMNELAKPNDGTVSLAETQLEKQTDYIEIPLSHTALVYSKTVAYQVSAFLTDGQFDKS